MLTIDTRQFETALRLYKDATRKDEAEILNKAGKDVVLRSMQFTERANASAIRTRLESNGLGYRIINARRSAKGQLGQTRKQIATRVRKFVRSSARSTGYVRAGWIKAAQSLGVSSGKVNEKSLAARGYAKPATPGDLSALLVNAARGASTVGAAALDKAMTFVAKDMTTYAQRKLAETARKYSAR